MGSALIWGFLRSVEARIQQASPGECKSPACEDAVFWTEPKRLITGEGATEAAVALLIARKNKAAGGV
jgi:hypothetical protein